MEDIRFVRKKVYDPILRLLHAGLGLSTLILLTTGWGSDLFDVGQDKASLWLVHIFAGYLFSISLVGRILWGFVGHREARWSKLWHLKIWREQVRIRRLIKQNGDFGHDPNASLAYIGFYIMAIGMVATGLAIAAIEHGEGPLTAALFDRLELVDIFSEPHEIGSTLIAVFILTHLLALLWHERSQPMVQAMFSGYQYRKEQIHKSTESNTNNTKEKL